MADEAQHEADPAAVARAIVDEIAYMTIASAGDDGRPWASPVWFAHAGYAEFVWVSRPDTRHSRNLAARPEVAIVIFDSRTPVGTGRAVYLEASAGEVVADEAEADRLMAVFSDRSLGQGGQAWSRDDATGDTELRLYRAGVSRAFLGVNDRRTEVTIA